MASDLLLSTDPDKKLVEPSGQGSKTIRPISLPGVSNGSKPAGKNAGVPGSAKSSDPSQSLDAFLLLRDIKENKSAASGLEKELSLVSGNTDCRKPNSNGVLKDGRSRVPAAGQDESASVEGVCLRSNDRTEDSDYKVKHVQLKGQCKILHSCCISFGSMVVETTFVTMQIKISFIRSLTCFLFTWHMKFP